eukprot:CAMPEP_0194534404 /NCGR_PEP_ID=MMETSP0253-20130528/72598_1 /TAXON_ID=2966 /ORGANISM="Noctiluca scintillans" /LENGTH=339 /DNA_ID=CAMNT_0039380063 /DNA_START=59 /DNA_END=1074 /DNA_ORIENTATION=+
MGGRCFSKELGGTSGSSLRHRLFDSPERTSEEELCVDSVSPGCRAGSTRRSGSVPRWTPDRARFPESEVPCSAPLCEGPALHPEEGSDAAGAVNSFSALQNVESRLIARIARACDGILMEMHTCERNRESDVKLMHQKIASAELLHSTLDRKVSELGALQAKLEYQETWRTGIDDRVSRWESKLEETGMLALRMHQNFSSRLDALSVRVDSATFSAESQEMHDRLIHETILDVREAKSALVSCEREVDLLNVRMEEVRQGSSSISVRVDSAVRDLARLAPLEMKVHDLDATLGDVKSSVLGIVRAQDYNEDVIARLSALEITSAFLRCQLEFRGQETTR